MIEQYLKRTVTILASLAIAWVVFHGNTKTITHFISETHTNIKVKKRLSQKLN